MIKNVSSYSSKQRNYKYKKLQSSEALSLCYDDDDSNSNELQSRTKNLDERIQALQNSITLVERPIQRGESLTSISLKYRIPIAELKRVNKLQKETEFYALNSLKIPVDANSALYELLQEELGNENAAPGPSHVERLGSSDNDNETAIPVGIISISQILREKKTRKEAKLFLENMRKDLLLIQNKTSTYKDSLDEAAATLTEVAFVPVENKVLRCSGADWGLSWWKVLAVSGLLIIGIPCIYLLFYS